MDPAVDGESEARLATVPTPLKASDPRGHPDGQSTADLRGAEQEDDCFFDCEEMLHGENASPDAQKESLTPEEGAGEGGVETETLKSSGDREEVGRGDESVSGGGRTEERGDEVKGRGGELAEGWNEDDERWEEVAEEKGADSDSELKEEVEAPEFDEEHLRELEKDLTEEEKESRREESMALKEKGNGQFKSGEHEQAEDSYTAALGVCPVCCSKERSILFSNRAAARLHLDKKEKAISDCTKVKSWQQIWSKRNPPFAWSPIFAKTAPVSSEHEAVTTSSTPVQEDQDDDTRQTMSSNSEDEAAPTPVQEGQDDDTRTVVPPLHGMKGKTTALGFTRHTIELNPNYVRAILRRAELYEKTDKLDEALDDYKAVLERDPSLPAAREACMRLPRQIEERNEKLKDEMMSKLKDLGNMFLRPFGLSTSNFQVNQDSGTGSYSVNFVQNPNNNNR